MNNSEKVFWNSGHIVEYFAEKPADHAVVARLDKLNHSSSPFNIKALDLGCGGGRHSEALASRGYDLTAIDRNPSMLSHTQQRLGNIGLSASYAQMSIDDMGIKSNSMDVIIATGVLHQAKSISEYDKAVSEVSRIMKKSGLLSMNIFTNAAWDDSYYIPNIKEPLTVRTREGLDMTLLSRDIFYDIASSHGLELEQEISHEIKKENTGVRSVLKAHMLRV